MEKEAEIELQLAEFERGLREQAFEPA